jgi:hypothetical protein
MARFLYEDPRNGELVESIHPCGKAPRTITLPDGTVCERNLGAEVTGRGPGTPGCWPMISRALAVHPSQSREYMEFAAKHGVPTQFDRMGHPVFESRGHRRRYAELVGASDFDGGYSDPHCG